MTITRRRILASGVQLTAALAMGSQLAAARDRAERTGEHLTFFDARFPHAEPLAAALPGAGQLQSVRGDPSGLIGRIAGHDSRAGSLRLQGVTTESIPFCLEQFARTHHEVAFESRRVDRDLFIWSLQLRARTRTA